MNKRCIHKTGKLKGWVGCTCDPSPVVYIQFSLQFFLNPKFCFGTVLKIIVKFDLKHKIKRDDTLNTHLRVGDKIKQFFQLAAIFLLKFVHTVVTLFQFKRIGLKKCN